MIVVIVMIVVPIVPVMMMMVMMDDDDRIRACRYRREADSRGEHQSCDQFLQHEVSLILWLATIAKPERMTISSTTACIATRPVHVGVSLRLGQSAGGCYADSTA
jgi:hypothetical protein